MGEIVRNQLRTECSLFPDEAVPGTLFSIFSRHWKDLYIVSLMQLYQTCIQQSDTFKVDRDEADMILRDCIRKYKENGTRELIDEEGRKITSSYVYASLRKAGWFIQEYDEADKSVYLWFPSYSAAFIRALNEMYKPSGITAGTYVKTITSALEGIIGGENDPWSLLLYARENAEKFIAAFLDIITETRQQLQRIRAEKDTGKMLQSLERMLTEVTEGSLRQLYDEGLNDMAIIRIRKDLLQIRANQAILQKMEDEISTRRNGQEEDADLLISDTLDFLEQQLCSGAKAKYQELTETVARYYRTCRDSIGQTAVDTNTARCQVSKIISWLAGHDDELSSSLEKALGMPKIELISSGSLYKPVRTVTAVNHDADMLAENRISLTASDLAGSVVKYSAEYLNQKLDEMMQGKKVLTNEDFVLNTREDFDLCMEMILNFGSSRPEDKYHAVCLQEEVKQGNYVMSRFYIKRRGAVEAAK